LKHQYFGDLNDYRKYGLLRALTSGSNLRLLIAWMLTPDDGRTDGRKIGYLNKPSKYERFDAELFRNLRHSLSTAERHVSLMETSNLLADAAYYSEVVPDARVGRARWFESLKTLAGGCDLVFLDPDNGLEVPTKPMGRQDSSKYVYWREIRELWGRGASLLIYQHFPRKKRSEFVAEGMNHLGQLPGAPLVEAFVTGNVVFLLAGQNHHTDDLRAGFARVQDSWSGQIKLGTTEQQAATRSANR